MPEAGPTHHVVGVLPLNEGREHVDPVLHGAGAPQGVAGFIEEVPGQNIGVLLVQLAAVGVAPAEQQLVSISRCKTTGTITSLLSQTLAACRVMDGDDMSCPSPHVRNWLMAYNLSQHCVRPLQHKGRALCWPQ